MFYCFGVELLFVRLHRHDAVHSLAELDDGLHRTRLPETVLSLRALIRPLSYVHSVVGLRVHSVRNCDRYVAAEMGVVSTSVCVYVLCKHLPHCPLPVPLSRKYLDV